jgi:hypothetical protein
MTSSEKARSSSVNGWRTSANETTEPRERRRSSIANRGRTNFSKPNCTHSAELRPQRRRQGQDQSAENGAFERDARERLEHEPADRETAASADETAAGRDENKGQRADDADRQSQCSSPALASNDSLSRNNATVELHGIGNTSGISAVSTLELGPAHGHPAQAEAWRKRRAHAHAGKLDRPRPETHGRPHHDHARKSRVSRGPRPG